MVVTVSETDQSRNFVIAGAGYVGKRLGTALESQCSTIVSLSRVSEHDQKMRLHRHIDLDHPDAETVSSDGSSIVFYLVPPNPDRETDCRIRNFLEHVLTNPPEKLILISTTGVYGDCNGRWVNENEPVNPQTERAKRRLDVEEFSQTWASRCGVELVILRVPGIYGPGRVPVQRIQRGLKYPPRSEVGYSNRIHVDDLVAICVEASARPGVDGIFNVSDGCPLRIIDYMNLVAELWNLPPVEETPACVAFEQMSSVMKSYIRESRKIDNTKLLHELKYKLRYPNPREGLKSCQDSE